MNTTPEARDASSARLNRAALMIATAVDVRDRMTTDPEYPADRSARADHLRAERDAADLREFREALAEWEANF